MTYRKQLSDFIFNGDGEGMNKWIEEQPLLDQPEILRELRELALELAEENGENINELIEGFESFDEKINTYEDRILDEKLAEAKLEMALEKQDKAIKEMVEMVEGMREYVIECISTNAPNADAMRELAKLIITFEKDAGTYDPKNWKAIK